MKDQSADCPLSPTPAPLSLRDVADRADDALQKLARLKHNATIAEWVETAAPLAALILAARTL